MTKTPTPATGELQSDRRRFVAGAATLLSAGSLTACATAPAADTRGRFEFALIGDMPYNRAQEAEYDRVMQELNARDLAFDPRPYERNPASSRPPGEDATYDYVLGTFNASKNPLVMTPGDNDWADLAEMQSRKIDPLDRLAKVRSLFYPKGSSLGQRRMPVTSQADVDSAHAAFRENLNWSIGGVDFVTLHIIGSNDNMGRGPALEAEQRQRKAANLSWLKRAFAQARERKSLGFVIIIHANIGFENLWPASYHGRYYRPLSGAKAPKPEPTVYDDYIRALSAEMEDFGTPTLLLHGDTHLFRIDKPLFSTRTQRPFEHFTRVETFGWPDTHWVSIEVDPAQPQVFTVRPRMVPGNSPNRRAPTAG
jgi:hypothetical protein